MGATGRSKSIVIVDIAEATDTAAGVVCTTSRVPPRGGRALCCPEPAWSTKGATRASRKERTAMQHLGKRLAKGESAPVETDESGEGRSAIPIDHDAGNLLPAV